MDCPVPRAFVFYARKMIKHPKDIIPIVNSGLEIGLEKERTPAADKILLRLVEVYLKTPATTCSWASKSLS